MLSKIWNGVTKTRQAIGNIIFLLIALLITMGIFASVITPDGVGRVTSPSVLVLNPAGMLVEETREKEFIELLVPEASEPPEVLLWDVAKVIKAAKTDERITALALELGQLGIMGPSHVQYLGGLLDDFKTSGKPIYAYSDHYSQMDYALAARADTVMLHSSGMVIIQGYGNYPLYFKEGLEKLGVTVNIFRVGTHKAAVEPLMRNSMSDEARANATALMGELWGQWLDDVARLRNIEQTTLSTKLINIGESLEASHGNMGQMALDIGLVDQLTSRAEWDKFLSSGANEDERNVVEYEDYLSDISTFNTPKDTIAVITASGTILDGEQPAGTIGGDTLAKQLIAAGENDRVKAVVLRINSGGGSAFASEIIRQEVDELKAMGKPVVVSMGPVAASGGYWIAATADEIWAMPTTITGSIGIFGVIPTFEKTLGTLGVHADGVGTSGLSDFGRIGMPMSEESKVFMQSFINNGYENFLSLVGKGRGMDRDAVDAIAQGRVWTGKRAQELGLVDKLGGLDDAITSVAVMAKLDDYRVKFIEEKPEGFARFIADLMGHEEAARMAIRTTPADMVLRQLKTHLSELLSLNDPKNVYAICETCKVVQ